MYSSADEFGRIAAVFAADGKAVAVKDGDQHALFVNIYVGRFEVDDVVALFVQGRHHGAEVVSRLQAVFVLFRQFQLLADGLLHEVVKRSGLA